MTVRSRRLLPWLVLLAGLAVTLVVSWGLARAGHGREQVRFERLVDSAVGSIEARILVQLTLLRGTAGFFNGSEQVTRRDFELYVRRLGLERNYPGVLGIGFAAYRSDATGIDRLARDRREMGETAFRPWPEGDRQAYSAILYLEPMNRLNRAALGYDMLSDPVRRQAMIESARTGLAVASGPVRLVQEIEAVKQPGFLIYAPLYEGGAGPDRRLFGWVYSPLRAWDLFGAVLANHPLDQFSIEITDLDGGEGALLYRSSAPVADPAFASSRHLDVAGRRWRIEILSRPGFARRGPAPIAGVAGAAGILISLLVAIILRQQIESTAATRIRVREKTAALRQANARLVAEAKARESAEAQVRQMQKIEAMGQLTGGIAHDFNNMLSVVLGNLDLAERRAAEPDRLHRVLRQARLGAEKAAQLTERLLAFARRQPLAPEAVHPASLLADMRPLLERALGESIQLEVEADADLWGVHVDPSQLESALLNIAINARDAMPAGGRFTTRLANRRFGEGGERPPRPFMAPADYVEIGCADTGLGMEVEIAERAFEPFFTTKPVGKGTGLGLSQVFGFAKQSGGYLLLESRPGEGTAVRLFLPRDPSVTGAGSRLSAAGDTLPRARSGECLLVVEDEAQVREMTAETLRELGYGVIEAADGAEGRDRLDESGRIDLLLTDVVMPEMDGPQLARLAADLRPDLPVLFMTGYSGERLGPAQVRLLRKPFTASQLARAVREALDN